MTDIQYLDWVLRESHNRHLSESKLNCELNRATYLLAERDKELAERNEEEL